MIHTASGTPNSAPGYYVLQSGRDASDIIDECGWGEGFRLGNVIKYIVRAGKKPGADGIVDLRKAASYIDAEIAAREAEKDRVEKYAVEEDWRKITHQTPKTAGEDPL